MLAVVALAYEEEAEITLEERKKDLLDHRDDSTFSFDPSSLNVKKLNKSKDKKKIDSRKGVLLASYSRKKTRRRKKGKDEPMGADAQTTNDSTGSAGGNNSSNGHNSNNGNGGDGDGSSAQITIKNIGHGSVTPTPSPSPRRSIVLLQSPPEDDGNGDDAEGRTNGGDDANGITLSDEQLKRRLSAHTPQNGQQMPIPLLQPASVVTATGQHRVRGITFQGAPNTNPNQNPNTLHPLGTLKSLSNL